MRCSFCSGSVIVDDWDGELHCLLCTRLASAPSKSLHTLSAGPLPPELQPRRYQKRSTPSRDVVK
jgi:hypothetical protein